MATEETKKPEAADPKKLVMAIIETLSHRHGRPPTAEEISKALVDEPKQAQETEQSEQQAQEDAEPAMPKVLSFMIHYGMKTGKDGSRAEDPTNPLYYADDERKRWFDVHNGEWLTEKPHIIDSLPSRPLGESDSQKDLFDAIINGVMDHEDYGLLSNSHDMLDPRCHRAYALVNQLRENQEDLAKSLESDEEFEPIEGDDSSDTVEGSTDMVREIFAGAGLASHNAENGPGSSEEDEGVEQGTNAPEEIKNATLSPGVEYRVRRLIQDEIAKALDMIRQEIYSALNGQDSDQENYDEQSYDQEPEIEDGVDFSEGQPLDL